MVGIYSRNRPEWVITEQAANAFSMIVVPLYDTLGEEAVEHILAETKVKIVFCTNDKIQQVLVWAVSCTVQQCRDTYQISLSLSLCMRNQLIPVLGKSDITHIVTFDPFEDEDAKNILQERNISLHTIDELIALVRAVTFKTSFHNATHSARERPYGRASTLTPVCPCCTAHVCREISTPRSPFPLHAMTCARSATPQAPPAHPRSVSLSFLPPLAR
jgi:hypothetical protein